MNANGSLIIIYFHQQSTAIAQFV